MGERLTEAQIAALRPQITEYPERRIITPRYPAPRRKRGVPMSEQAALPADEQGALPTGGLSGNPTVRLWTVAINSNAVGSSIQRGSPSFAGPALIHSMTGVINATQVSGVTYPVQVAYDINPYTDSDGGPSAAKLNGTHIAEAADPFINGAGSIPFNDGFISNLSGNPLHIPIGVYVPLDRFYIGIRIQGLAAGQSYANFMLRIIEHAPPDSITWI